MVFHLAEDHGGQGYVNLGLICLSLYPILTRRMDRAGGSESGWKTLREYITGDVRASQIVHSGEAPVRGEEWYMGKVTVDQVLAEAARRAREPRVCQLPDGHVVTPEL